MDWNTYLHTVKRKWENRENEMEDEWMKRRKVVGADMTGMFSAIAAAAVLEKEDRKKRGRNIIRDKSWWTSGMKNWSDSEFKKRVRINRKTFEYLLEKISPQLRKTSTNLNQDPTPIGLDFVQTGSWLLLHSHRRFVRNICNVSR